MCFDRILQMCTDMGLNHFSVDQNKEKEFPFRRLLVLFLDEASVQFTLQWWLQYKMNMRVLCIRDPLHREWNDLKLAVSRTSLWWVITTTMLLYNLAYGPWEGCTWFQQMCEGIENLLETATPSDPLFEAL